MKGRVFSRLSDFLVLIYGILSVVWIFNCVSIDPEFTASEDASTAASLASSLSSSVEASDTGTMPLTPGTCKVLTDMEYGFLVLMGVEIMIKMWAGSFPHYFASKWNVFDLLVLTSAAIWEITVSQLKKRFSNWLFIIRTLRLLKLVTTFEYFKAIVTTIIQLIPFQIDFYVLIVATTYLFALLGMQLFGGKIPQRPEVASAAFRTSPYAESDLYGLNFDNFIDAMTTMFVVLVGNDWDSLASGFAFVTTSWAYLFFVFYVVIDGIIVTNLLVAFVIDAFLLQFDSLASKRNNKEATEVAGFVPQRSLDELFAEDEEEEPSAAPASFPFRNPFNGRSVSKSFLGQVLSAQPKRQETEFDNFIDAPLLEGETFEEATDLPAEPQEVRHVSFSEQ